MNANYISVFFDNLTNECRTLAMETLFILQFDAHILETQGKN